MTHPHLPDPQHPPVTVVGLGPMGHALAATLADRGHTTTVWNRTPGKADSLVAKGVRRAATVAEAVSASPLTLLCLQDYPTTDAVLAPARDALRDRVLVNLGTGTPEEARAAVGRAADRGARWLDGAIMVPPPLVGDPTSVFLYSGARDVFDAHRATLATLGDPRHLGPDPGLALLYNTALLEMMYATVNGFLHATALVGSAGVPAVTFADLALGWFMPSVLDPTFAGHLPDLDRGHYPGELGTLEMNLHALDHVTRTSEEQGVHTDQPRLMREIARRAVAEGHGAESYLSVLEVFKKAARVP
ncbi:NAD(P)-dependent oxidoreductase [Streptomyces avicenniae]|uniref:NAD(P)-dependent oxidoreductase n=1 Tax=Streptomyces avicenniae TaxID=500153 RepID=UPI00069C2932|nr:NAD(P)-binding domain-containing protein [Streptomyces avicenniae]